MKFPVTDGNKSPLLRNYDPAYTTKSPLLGEEIENNNRSARNTINHHKVKNLARYKSIELQDYRMIDVKSNSTSNKNNKYKFFNRSVDYNDISYSKESKVIHRHLFVTSLETFDSKRVILSLFLPTLLVMIFYYLLLPLKYRLNIISTETCLINRIDFHCIIKDDDKTLLFRFLKPINSLGFVKTYLTIGKLDHFKQYKMTIMLGNINSVDDTDDVNKIIYQQSIDASNYINSYINISKAEILSPQEILVNIPFNYLSLNQCLTFQPKWISVSLSSSDKIFESSSSSLRIIVQNEYFVVFLAIASLCASFLTLYIFYISVTKSISNARIIKSLVYDSNNQNQNQYFDNESIESRDRSLIEFILAEQIIVFFILFFLFICQDALGSIFILLNYFGVNLSNDNVLLADVILKTCGKFGFIVSFISYIDGLKYSKNYNQSSSTTKKNKHYNIEDEFWRKNNSLSIVSDIPVSTKVSTAHSEFQSLPFHHLLSISFLDYIHKKILFVLLSWGFIITLTIMKFKYRRNNKIYYCAYIVSPFIYFLLYSTLLIWTIWVFINTSKKLSKARLISTRFRQISFRTLLFQVNFSLLCVILCVCLIFYKGSIFAIFSNKSLSQFSTFILGWINYFGVIDLFLDEGHNLFSIQCPDFILFISLVSYVLSFSIISPIDMSSYIQNHSFVSLERYIPLPKSCVIPEKNKAQIMKKINYFLKKENFNRIVKLLTQSAKYLKSNSKSQIFCLETACILLEVSYQTYSNFNANKPSRSEDNKETNHRNKVESNNLYPKENTLQAMGLDIVTTFFNNEYATFGFVGQSDNSLVVAFRGSVLANLSIDMDFTQIPLPDMKKNKDYFFNIIKISTSSVPNDLEMKLDDLNNSLDSLMSVDSPFPVYTRNNSAIDLSNDGIQVETTNENNSGREIINDFVHKESNNIINENNRNQVFESRIDFYECMRLLGSYIPLVRQSFPQIHSGFWKAYKSIREEVLEAIVNRLYLHTKNRFSQYIDRCEQVSDNFISADEIFNVMDIHFCGHSLGGAIDLAINMSAITEAIYSRCMNDVKKLLIGETLNLKLLLWNPPSITVFTYGCPRIGNPAFVNLMNKNVKSIYRIVVNGDLVTMLPKIPFFYRHVGVPVLIDEEALGSITINPTIIENSFARSSTGNVSKHSLDVYRTCLEACFDKEEFSEYIKKEFFSFSKSAYDNIPDWLSNIV